MLETLAKLKWMELEMKTSSARIKIYGVNISKLYKLLKKNNIAMLDLCRENHKTIYFTVSGYNLKKLFALLDKSCYTITVVEYYGIKRAIEFFKVRFGYIVGLAFFIVLTIISNLFVSDIKIYGNNKVSSQEIYDCLSLNGIKKGSKITQCNNDQILSILTNNFEDISLVSVLKKGTNIVINIKEKQSVSDSQDAKFNDIVANFDGIVLELSVMQGTACVKVGDFFKKGDILIQGTFNDIDGNPVECKAQGSIKAKLMITSEIDFKTEDEIFVRTGKTIKLSHYSLFGLEFLKKQCQNTFENFETEQTEQFVFKNNILPLKLVQTTYHETQKQLVRQNFDDVKHSLQLQAKQNSQKLLEKSDNIINEFGEIVATEFGYKVKYTFEIIKEI